MCLLPSPQYCGDGRRILLPGWRSLAGAAAALRSAAVLDRYAWREDGVTLAGAHLDALGLYVRCFGHQDLQHAVLHRGLDLVRLDVAGQGDRAAEGAVITLGPVHLLLGGIVREAPLPLDRQQAVLEGDLQVLGLDAGKLGRHQVGVLTLGYVDRRRPGRGGSAAGELLAGPPAISPIRPQHLILRGTQVL